MNLIVDIGNTQAKLWLYENGTPKIQVCHADFDEALQSILKAGCPTRCGVATVGKPFAEISDRLRKEGINAIEINGKTPTPLKLRYRTPDTLGADRLAAAVGAWTLKPHRNLLVVDAGTCVTADFVDADGCYRGGNISLGISARLRAMHCLTARLPEVSKEGETPLIGFDTETAIRSGVINALRYEIEGFAHELRERHPELQIIFTGGDAALLCETLKIKHTIDPNLVARGINSIILYNENQQ